LVEAVTEAPFRSVPVRLTVMFWLALAPPGRSTRAAPARLAPVLGAMVSEGAVVVELPAIEKLPLVALA
jgi:hypothetical protein